MLTAMARELVTERGIGEPADAVWRQIQAEHGRMISPTPVTPEPLPSMEDVRPTAPTAIPVLSVPVAINALKFGSRPPSGHHLRRKEPPREDQLSLF